MLTALHVHAVWFAAAEGAAVRTSNMRVGSRRVASTAALTPRVPGGPPPPPPPRHFGMG